MRKTKLALMVPFLLLLVGCSAISEGVITNKAHENSYSYSTMSCVSYSSKGFCTSYMTIWHTVPDKWRFDLKNKKNDTGWVYVSYDTYNSFNVGDYFSPEGR